MGATKLHACLVGHDLEILEETRLQTGRETPPAELIDKVRTVALELGPFDSIGVGFPGIVDHERGTVLSSVMLTGWRCVDLRSQLEQVLGCPSVIDNDVNTAALAEVQVRKADAPDLLVYYTVGTGVGGAILQGGRLWRGAGNVAGEIGNTVVAGDSSRSWAGRFGSVNALASGRSIEIELGLDPGELVAAVKSDQPEVRREILRAARALGIAIGNTINLLGPDLIALGGGLASLGEWYLDAVRRAAQEVSLCEAWSACQVEFARAGERAGALGAAILALSANREAPAQGTAPAP